jgi:eukaryotic-like serine/threonine-protein kinase
VASQTGGGDEAPKSGAIDTFLRAVAHTPNVSMGEPPESWPERIAHFQILGVLGRGGMGVVFRAHDEGLRRTVALKVLPEASKNEEKRQRFLREARSAASIAHPNVAVVHQVGEAEGRVYIAMELVEGESLRQRLDRGLLDVPTALEWARQIASGLAAAHGQGIVHRDLKPENVMITPAGALKLLDFGLAKKLQLTTGPARAAGAAPAEPQVTSDEGRLMGTPAYMSPEQAFGEPVDMRSDVFSFGVVLYEMLAGARPFTGASNLGVLRSIERDVPRPLSQSRPGIPDGLDRLVARCLEKAPAARPASGAELSDALDRMVSADTVAPSSLAPARTRSAPPPDRWRRWALASALAVAAIGVGWRLWPASVRSPSVAPYARGGSALRAGDGGGPLGVAITDHPAPHARNAEAATAYASALQNLRDGSVALGRADLERATQLDPSLAEAHLRYVLYGSDAPRTALLEHASAASQFRDSLSERDATLLAVAQAEVADPADPEGVVARARDAAERYPNDAEVVWLYGNFIRRAGRSDEANPVYLRALELDPRFAEALTETNYHSSKPRPVPRDLAACRELPAHARRHLRRLRAMRGVRGRHETDGRGRAERIPRVPVACPGARAGARPARRDPRGAGEAGVAGGDGGEEESGCD